MDGPVRDSAHVWLGGSWRVTGSHWCFFQSRNDSSDLSLPSPLGIYQCDGKKEAEVAFSLCMNCKVGWMWVSNSGSVRHDKRSGFTLLYPLLFEEAAVDDPAFL